MRHSGASLPLRWAACSYLVLTGLALVDIAVVGVRGFVYGSSSGMVSPATLTLGLLALPIGLGVGNGQRFWRWCGLVFSCLVAAGGLFLVYLAPTRDDSGLLYFTGAVPRWLPPFLVLPYCRVLIVLGLAQFVASFASRKSEGPIRLGRARVALALAPVSVLLALWTAAPFLLWCLMLQPNLVTYMGRVTDDTGAPIAGATVQLSNHDLVGGARFEDERPRTDAEGRYRFDGVCGAGVRQLALRTGEWTEIRAEAEGHASAILPVLPLSADMQRRVWLYQAIGNHWPVPTQRRMTPPACPVKTEGNVIYGLDIVLPREATLSGRVVDETGAPVSGYGAYVTPEEQPERTLFQQRYDNPYLKSDSEGRFHIARVPLGTYVFKRWIDALRRYELAENPPLTLSPAEQLDGYTLVVPNFQVNPAEFGTLRGRVMRNGQPSKHGYVTFHEVEISDTSGNTGEDGRYEVAFLPPGEQLARFTMWLYEDQRGGAQLHAWRTVEILAGKATTLDVAVEGHGMIHGDFVGLPDTRWLVHIEDINRPSESARRAGTWKFEGNSRYEIPGLPPGDYRIVATCRIEQDVIAKQTREVVLGAGEKQRIDFDFLKTSARTG